MKPTVLSFVLCRDLAHNPRTQTVNIRDVLTWLPADEFPHVEPQLAVFYEVTGHRGLFQDDIRIVSLEDDETVFDFGRAGVNFRSPLATIGGGKVSRGGHEFPSEGWYAVELRCKGELLAQRRFFVGRLERAAEINLPL